MCVGVEVACVCVRPARLTAGHAEETSAGWPWLCPCVMPVSQVAVLSCPGQGHFHGGLLHGEELLRLEAAAARGWLLWRRSKAARLEQGQTGHVQTRQDSPACMRWRCTYFQGPLVKCGHWASAATVQHGAADGVFLQKKTFNATLRA